VGPGRHDRVIEEKSRRVIEVLALGRAGDAAARRQAARIGAAGFTQLVV